MRCPQCDHDNAAGIKFCGECGARLAAVCVACGAPNPPTNKFCGECGASLTPGAAASRFPSAESYTPKHLAEKILTSKSALEGERKQVTVLFCDIADSSHLAERLDPEAMHQLMDRALRLMAAAVHRYEGTVNQFLGDGLMALFGAPVALEDHAVRAVQAALAIQETFGGYSQQLTQERGLAMRLRQGLNTGLVVVGRIGDDLEPKDKRQKTFEAIRTLTVAGSQRRPHVVIVEDLHWIDRTSEDYFAFFMAGLAGVPFLLLTTHRPGYTVRWADKPHYTQLALDLLAEGETEALVAALLGSPTLPAELLRLVHEKAEGNPLFVEEITTSLLERGMLVRRNGEILWTSGAPVEVPASIQDLIRARIDRLEEPVKRTVQAAAVIGREFGLRLLTRISEMAAEVQQYLDTLKHVELIRETRFFPELEYIFKHALIQDVAYQSLLTHRRQELHEAIGRAIEDLYADRLEEQAPILAYHYARSERQDKAVEYALLAGDRAARLYANAEATTYYEQALTMARALPASPEVWRAEIDAALKLATVGVTRQDIQRDQTNLQAARALAEQLQDDARLARVLYWLGRIPYVLGDPQTAIEYAKQSLELAERLGDEALAAPPVNLMGRAYALLSEFAKSAVLIERSVEQMRTLGNKTEEASAAAYAGWVLGQLGEFESAFRYVERGLQLARDIQNPFTEAAAVFFHGVTSVLRGDWNRAIADFEDARRIADRTGDLFRVYITKVWEGWARTPAGDPGRGRMLLEEALALSVQLGTKMMVSYAKANLAAALLAMGERDAVVPLCQEALRLAAEAGDQFGKALAHRTLAEALFGLDPAQPQEAERAIVEAIRVQQEIGARPELARSYVSYARLLKAMGERERAREHLSQAIGMFRAMGMAWDLERAEQALREP